MVLSEIVMGISERSKKKLQVVEEIIREVPQFIEESQFTIDPNKYWFFKQTTGAPAGDHMLQISNNKVSCDGTQDSDTTEFNLYTAYDGTTPVCVIHCASGLYKGNLIQIKDNGDISFRKPLPGIIFIQEAQLNIDDLDDDVLFEYSYTMEEDYRFRLRDHKRHVLGFTDSGKASSKFSFDSDYTVFRMQHKS